MKIKYAQTKGNRIKKDIFFGVACHNPEHMWWVTNQGKWMDTRQIPKNSEICTHCELKINSVKAFRRRLKQWSKYMPRGSEFVLVGSRPEYNVYGRI